VELKEEVADTEPEAPPTPGMYLPHVGFAFLSSAGCKKQENILMGLLTNLLYSRKPEVVAKWHLSSIKHCNIKTC